MMPAYPQGPFTHCQRMFGSLQTDKEFFLPLDADGDLNPEALESEARALLRVLWPRIQERYPGATQEDALPALWTIVGMGGSLEDVDEAFRLFDLLARFGDKVAALELREASRALGDQADLFLDPWVRGKYQEMTGIHEFTVILWAYRSFLRLTEVGAERARQLSGLPKSPGKVRHDKKPEGVRSGRGPSTARPSGSRSGR
jgi:hypothetical protein